MATTYTPNFNLGKQEDLLDKFDMSVITRNADIIDEELHKRSTDTENKGKYLGKTETAAAAAKDGAGGNIAEQFADIAVKNSSGLVYTGSNQQGWHKAAECAFSEANSGRRIASFYISGTTSSVSGILNVNVISANSNTLAVGSLAARWGYRSNTINPENFVLVANLENDKIIAELWVKLTSSWQAYNFIRLRSVKLQTEIYDDTAWKACNSVVASESYPTVYDLTYVSVDDSAAKYDASGNDIATKLASLESRLVALESAAATTAE